MPAQTPTTNVTHNVLTDRQKVAVWDTIGEFTCEDGYAQEAQACPTVLTVGLLNDDAVANWLTLQLGFTVKRANVRAIRGNHDCGFRDKTLRKSGKGRKRRAIDRLERGYTDLYEWATRQGFTGPNRLVDVS